MWFCFASNWTKNLGIFFTDPSRKGFCDPNVTQVIINQVLKRTMFWVETTCWYLIDTTLLFNNKNIPPPHTFFFPTQLTCIMSVIFPPSPSRTPPPPPKKKQKKHQKQLIQLFSWKLLLGPGGSIRISPRQVLPKPFHRSDLCARQEPMASNGISTSIRGGAR